MLIVIFDFSSTFKVNLGLEQILGKGAKAAIITTELCNAAARHRASQLDISVIDLEELERGHLKDRLFDVMKDE